jgi:hypothetical protein
MILTSPFSMRTQVRPFAKFVLPTLFCSALTVPALCEKPADWDQAVMSAAAQPPTFWLNSDPSNNRGEGDLSGEIRYVGGVLSRLEEGPWGDAEGAFGLSDDSQGAARVNNSKQTDIACSDQGSLALLFRAPTDFSSKSGSIDQQLQVLFSRGTYGSEQPFEIALHQGSLRISHLQDGVSKTTTLGSGKLEQGAWYWLALTWERQDSATSITWRIWNQLDGLQQGSLNTGPLGFANTPLELAGRTSGDSLKDGAFSQVIVWSTPVSDDNWSKLESLLKGD